MFTNYLKIAIRNIIRNKAFTTINVIGLAIGLSVSYMMILNVLHETSYDKHNEKFDRIYRVVTDTKDMLRKAETPYLFAPTAKETIPEIDNIARVYTSRNTVIKYSDEKHRTRYGQCVDPDLFEILTIPLKSGNPQSVFSNRNSIVISEKFARQIFQDKTAIGEYVNVSIGKLKYNLKITGVFKDLPQTSTLQADCLLPMFIGAEAANSRAKNYVATEQWDYEQFLTYVLLSEKSSPKKVEKKLVEFEKYGRVKEWQKNYQLQPMKDFYLKSDNLAAFRIARGDSLKVEIFTIIALLILTIACFNFIVLTIAQSNKRIKEVGVRKIMGANRIAFIKQISFESMLLALLSAPFAWYIFSLLYTHTNKLLEIKVQDSWGLGIVFLTGFIVATMLIGLITGVTVALYLAKFNPLDVIKRTFKPDSPKTKLKYGLVFVQMILFISMICTAFLTFKQVHFFRTKDFGFDKENLMIINLPGGKLRDHYGSLKNEFMSNPNILGVSAVDDTPLQLGKSMMKIPIDNNIDKSITFYGMMADHDFLQTMQMKLVNGRYFDKSKDVAKDTEWIWIINETAAKEIGLQECGTMSIYGGQAHLTIIGIVQDFHFESFRKDISPIYVSFAPSQYLNELVVRIAPNNVMETIAWMENKWKKFSPGEPMNYKFFDERVDLHYRSELRFFKLINYATALTIFVTCLGLFGLMMFIMERRTKEIGIRKVVGASVVNLLVLLTKDFSKWIILANIIAWPIAWLAISKWLQNFAYRIDLTIWPFLFAGLAAFAIAFITVGLQAVRAATANPVDALRYE